MSADRPILLLTRQARFIDEAYLQQIRDIGYQPQQVPTMQVLPVSNDEVLLQQLQHLDNYTDIVFISRNAVQYGLPLIKQFGAISKQTRVLTVGEQTANELLSHQIKSVVPNSGSGAKALMQLPELVQMHNRRVLIMRGSEGMDWLRDEMVARGAEVVYAICYRIQTPQSSAAVLTNTLGQITQNAVVFIHSVQSAINLLEMAGENKPEINQLRLIVGSARIADFISGQGWLGQVGVAKSPSNQDMLDCLAREV